MSTDDQQDTIAWRIMKARALSHMAQSDLAQASGIAAAQISRYEQGRNTPRPEILAKLASVLGTTMEWLRNGGEEGHPVQKDLPKVERKQFPSDEVDKYLLRFDDDGMRHQLKEMAKKTGRKTLNAEINAALRNHIATGGEAPAQATGVELSEAAMKRIADMVVMRMIELQQGK
jgi:hypothetical protein